MIPVLTHTAASSSSDTVSSTAQAGKGRSRQAAATWFRHDVSISQDYRMMYIESRTGLTGYALYFKIREEMSQHEGFVMPFDEITQAILAHKFRVSLSDLSDFIVAATHPNIQMLQLENEQLTCPSLQKDLQALTERREKEASRLREKRNAQKSVAATKINNQDVAATNPDVAATFDTVYTVNTVVKNSRKAVNRAVPQKNNLNPPNVCVNSASEEKNSGSVDATTTGTATQTAQTATHTQGGDFSEGSKKTAAQSGTQNQHPALTCNASNNPPQVAGRPPLQNAPESVEQVQAALIAMGFAQTQAREEAIKFCNFNQGHGWKMAWPNALNAWVIKINQHQTPQPQHGAATHTHGASAYGFSNTGQERIPKEGDPDWPFPSRQEICTLLGWKECNDTFYRLELGRLGYDKELVRKHFTVHY